MAIEHFEPKFNDGSLIPAEDVIHMLRQHYGDGPVTVGQLESMGDWIPLADCAAEGLHAKILACARASRQHDYDEAIAMWQRRQTPEPTTTEPTTTEPTQDENPAQPFEASCATCREPRARGGRGHEVERGLRLATATTAAAWA